MEINLSLFFSFIQEICIIVEEAEWVMMGEDKRDGKKTLILYTTKANE